MIDWEIISVNVDVAVVEVAVNLAATTSPTTDRAAYGVVVPIPKRLLALSQTKLLLFCVKRPFVPTNGTLFAVNGV